MFLEGATGKSARKGKVQRQRTQLLRYHQCRLRRYEPYQSNQHQMSKRGIDINIANKEDRERLLGLLA